LIAGIWRTEITLATRRAQTRQRDAALAATLVTAEVATLVARVVVVIRIGVAGY
jgi:hypothetical protein